MNSAPTSSAASVRSVALQLHQPQPNGMASPRGMATLIDSSHALTPAHVVSWAAPGARVYLSSPFWRTEGGFRSATMIWADPELDVAVLRLEQPTQRPDIDVVPEPPERGARWKTFLLIPTQPGGAGVEGVVDALAEVDRRILLKLRATEPPAQLRGMSGAPLVTSEGLVGIVWGSDPDDPAVWYALPGEVLETARSTGAGKMLRVPGSVVSDGERSRADIDALLHRLSPSSRKAIAYADAARRLQALDRIHMEHLAVGLFEKETGPTRKAFERAGVTRESLREALSDVVDGVVPVVETPPSDIERIPPLSEHVRIALQSAARSADRWPAGRTQSRDLLYGVLSVTECRVSNRLGKLGVHLTEADLAVGRGPHLPSTSIEPLYMSLAGYASDAVNAADDDRLGIQPEVNALCAVLAARSTQPPLSLGLFGDWGTGKSFFMKKMEERIDKLAQRAQASIDRGEPTDFCPHVVQLWFNAWHYTDTNLWASLITEIFEGLATALDEGTLHSQHSRQKLVECMKSRQEELAQAERERATAEARIRESEEKLAVLKREEMDLPDAMEAMASDEGFRHFVLKAPGVKEKMEAAAREAGFQEVKWAATELQDELIRLRGFWGTVRATWLWMTEAKGRGWRVPLLVGILLFLLALPPLIALAAEQLSSGQLSAALMAMAAPMTAAVEWLRRGLQRGSRIVSMLEDARQQAEGIIEEVQQRQRKRADSLVAYRQQLQKELTDAQAAVQRANEELRSLEGQLREHQADQQLYRFIRERCASTDYSQHRGIIGRAQEDFERLSNLLTSAKTADDGSELPRVDRIILYIDDLDRCPEKQVVQVLQAVHLLLAFPLFVVVVGVDSRWLLHALKGHSSIFGVKRNGQLDLSPGEAVLWASTPQNYLEKIFQIPFVLRPMDSDGFGSLLDSLVPTTEPEARRSGTGQERVTDTDPGEAPAADEPDQTLEPERLDLERAVPPAENRAGAVAGEGEGSTPLEPLLEVVDAGATAPSSPYLVAEMVPEDVPAQSQPAERGTPADEEIIDMTPRALTLYSWELEYMKKLYPVISSPRAAKRLVNLYRLILVSVRPAELERFRDPADGDFRVVLLLLALLTGYPEETGDLLLDLSKAESGERWWNFVDRQQVRAGPIELNARFGSVHDHMRAMEAARWTLLLEALGKIRPLIREDEPCARFARWGREVARYSFQSGRAIAAIRH